MAECLTPYMVKHNGDQIPVPCNKCPNCVKRRISGWSFRLLQESKNSLVGHFITLTYDTDNVPLSANGFMALRKRDLQLFFKRLRKAHGRKPDPDFPIKYYACGEYGGRTRRPHYHIILFNAKLELIQPAWNLGSVHYGQISGASVGYTLKYMSKPSKIPLHRNDDRTKEFSLMSKGLGKNYLTKNMVQWHKSDLKNRMYCNLEDGKKIAMPRYYKEKIYSEHDRQIAGKHQLEKLLEKEAKIINHVGLENYNNAKEAARRAAFLKVQHSQNDRNKV